MFAQVRRTLYYTTIKVSMICCNIYYTFYIFLFTEYNIRLKINKKSVVLVIIFIHIVIIITLIIVYQCLYAWHGEGLRKVGVVCRNKV